MALLCVARLSFDVMSAAAYVYPDSDFYQPGLALFVLGWTLLAAFGFASIRLVQKKFMVGGSILLAVLCTPFFFRDAVDRQVWKFNANKSEYVQAIRADKSPAPRYRTFDWGNRNVSFGGGVVFERIVYDESDEEPKRWLAVIPSLHPSCRRSAKSLGDHFYYTSEEC